jgi:hypothetical protein
MSKRNLYFETEGVASWLPLWMLIINTHAFNIEAPWLVIMSTSTVSALSPMWLLKYV